jgi:ribosomal protein L11 methylase PrmA
MDHKQYCIFHGSSFRDPSGIVFQSNGSLFRRINKSYAQDYELLMGSGLYAQLTAKEALVEHAELDAPRFNDADFYKTIQPREIGFISYPYEWSFSQLKDAALLTLDIQLSALEHGMTLKDASAYNIQFEDGRPVFIDTLSFEKYSEGAPWVAYRQFCQHFLAPLALMAKRDVSLSQLSRVFIDGVPLELASRLLPASSWLKWGLLGHVHLHAKAQRTYADTQTRKSSGNTVSRNALIGLIESLRSAVEGLEWKPRGTEWGDYYEKTNYTSDAFDQKEALVDAHLNQAQPSSVWDLGANTGVFSRIASRKNIHTVAFDSDPAAVEKNYRAVKHSKEKFLLPLVLDLTNPSPSIGWSNAERESIANRGPVDCVIALALIHHLAISNNVPLSHNAKFFSEICQHLIIEFVPKSDSQVQRLLLTRKDIFGNYDQVHFEQAFSEYFLIIRQDNIPGSERTLYLMQKR